jgi:hypothetical protein
LSSPDVEVVAIGVVVDPGVVVAVVVVTSAVTSSTTMQRAVMEYLFKSTTYSTTLMCVHEYCFM